MLIYIISMALFHQDSANIIGYTTYYNTTEVGVITIVMRIIPITIFLTVLAILSRLLLTYYVVFGISFCSNISVFKNNT